MNRSNYRAPSHPAGQRGAALLVSLIFLLMLTLLGISSMQNATLQEKMAGSVSLRNQSFQFAEGALRLGESAIQANGFALDKCTGNFCVPPPESTASAPITAGYKAGSQVTWVKAGDNGFYAIQNLGTTMAPVLRPQTCSSYSSVTLYRITAVGTQGASKTVLESMYANC